jgi:hypothetical protein
MATTALEALRTIQRELGSTHAEDVPKGWLTVQEWADKAGMSTWHVRSVLHRAKRMGKVECQVFRIKNGNRIFGVQHYRPKK